jgi:hypothetical protein
LSADLLLKFYEYGRSLEFLEMPPEFLQNIGEQLDEEEIVKTLGSCI